MVKTHPAVVNSKTFWKDIGVLWGKWIVVQLGVITLQQERNHQYSWLRNGHREYHFNLAVACDSASGDVSSTVRLIALVKGPESGGHSMGTCRKDLYAHHVQTC